jgi:hypothetical protein
MLNEERKLIPKTTQADQYYKQNKKFITILNK